MIDARCSQFGGRAASPGGKKRPRPENPAATVTVPITRNDSANRLRNDFAAVVLRPTCSSEPSGSSCDARIKSRSVSWGTRSTPTGRGSLPNRRDLGDGDPFLGERTKMTLSNTLTNRTKSVRWTWGGSLLHPDCLRRRAACLIYGGRFLQPRLEHFPVFAADRGEPTDNTPKRKQRQAAAG